MTWLAMAASFLVAVVLGWRFQDRWYAGDVDTRAPVQTIADAGQKTMPSAPRRDFVVPDPAWRAFGARERHHLPGARCPGPEGSPSGVRPFRLPATEQDRLDGKWLSGLPRAW